jgi:integrase
MRVYRQTYSRAGCQREVARWYVELRFEGRRCRFPAFPDRRASETLGRQLDRLAALHAVGDPLDPTLAMQIERWPAALRERCAALGLVSRARATGMRPLTELVEDFEAGLRARDRSDHHVRVTVAYVRRILAGCCFRVWSDIRGAAVERFLRLQRDGGLSTGTTNQQLVAIRHFCNWAVENGLAAESPLRATKKLNARVDQRRQRRSLSDEDLGRLFEMTRLGPARFGMEGERRALMYRFAYETGIRAAELASLRVGSFDLDLAAPRVTVSAAASKRRREDVLPLRPELARALVALLAGRRAWEKAFEAPAHFRPTRALKLDLAAAGLAWEDEEGRVFDFHAFRVQFISALVKAGVDARTVQRLARHSTPNLTLGVYTKLGRDAERSAIERLPCLAPGLASEDAEAGNVEQRRAAGGAARQRERPPGARMTSRRPRGRVAPCTTSTRASRWATPPTRSCSSRPAASSPTASPTTTACCGRTPPEWRRRWTRRRTTRSPTTRARPGATP